MSSRQTPNRVKRQLRQESGFGCCFCGCPFIQYHHIIPFAHEAHMRPEDMMTICANCHHLCTTNAISTDKQRAAKLHPINIKRSISKGVLYTDSGDLCVAVAGGLAKNTPNLLTIHGETILSVRKAKTGETLVSANIHDSYGNNVAKIIENEWWALNNLLWDFEIQPKRVIARSEPQKISLEVDARKSIINLKGRWYSSGLQIVFSQSKAKIGSNEVSIGTVSNCANFITIGSAINTP